MGSGFSCFDVFNQFCIHLPVCATELVALLLLSLALLTSLCLNVIFCILRRRTSLCTSTDVCWCSRFYEGEGLTQDEEHYLHDLNHHENNKNPHNFQEQQENPIYGNITTDRRGSVEVYEMMTMCPSDRVKPDLNYASLDLKVAKKRKRKHCHQQGQTQGRNNPQDQLPVHLTPPVNAFLGLEADMDACLPSRDNSPMVSHSSIYLNSQQIAQEAEEMERERGINMEREKMGWQGVRGREGGGSRNWKEGREIEECTNREEYSNGIEGTQQPEEESIQNSTDHFIISFSSDSDQQVQVDDV
ncbi:uncharacterized protein LOC115433194 isoform X2 [Sphaeramia orbicularis]|uniref:uncharacterized protein LOC115433194 isoform X2 n=1 Tax=Sphaeramia orbicularis TaxID=375764 RepID=UPI00117E7B5C|nr:uncharacterized protein LOC115433194 isoform X2 [Sphaeramia orbicularis]